MHAHAGLIIINTEALVKPAVVVPGNERVMNDGNGAV